MGSRLRPSQSPRCLLDYTCLWGVVVGRPSCSYCRETTKGATESGRLPEFPIVALYRLGDVNTDQTRETAASHVRHLYRPDSESSVSCIKFCLVALINPPEERVSCPTHVVTRRKATTTDSFYLRLLRFDFGVYRCVGPSQEQEQSSLTHTALQTHLQQHQRTKQQHGNNTRGTHPSSPSIFRCDTHNTGRPSLCV